MVGVVVDRLLAEEDEVGLFLGDDWRGGVWQSARVSSFCVGFDQDAAMGAHGEGGEDDVGGLFGADGDDDDLVAVAGLGELHGGLDGVLVEGVHRHADVVGLDAGLVRADADADVVIDDALDGDEDFHRVPKVCGFMANRTQWGKGWDCVWVLRGRMACSILDVIPAKAGTQLASSAGDGWIPSFRWDDSGRVGRRGASTGPHS